MHNPDLIKELSLILFDHNSIPSVEWEMHGADANANLFEFFHCEEATWDLCSFTSNNFLFWNKFGISKVCNILEFK